MDPARPPGTDAGVHLNSGYSSGWCEESFGIPLVAVEVECQACGDENCRFIMAPPARIEAHLASYRTGRAKSSGRERKAHGAPAQVPEFFERKRMEESLREANRMLESRVRERTEELERTNAALAAKVVELELAEGRQSRLMRELDHRVKNTLAGVISIAESSLVGAKSLQDFRGAYLGRILALARVHESLTQSRWLGADVAELAERTLRPHARG